MTWTERDTDETGVPQDESGPLWDVLWKARFAALDRRNTGCNRLPFTFLRVRCGSNRAQRMTLDMIIGPGDDGEPVVMIVLQHED